MVIRWLARIANRPRLLVITTVLNFVLCGLLYALIENTGPIAGTWWALVTGSTVGYGDFYPASTVGRGVAAWLIVTSVFVLSPCISAAITARLVDDKHLFSDDEQKKVFRDLERLGEKVDRVGDAVAGLHDYLSIATAKGIRQEDPEVLRQLTAINETLGALQVRASAPARRKITLPD